MDILAAEGMMVQDGSTCSILIQEESIHCRLPEKELDNSRLVTDGLTSLRKVPEETISSNRLDMVVPVVSTSSRVVSEESVISLVSDGPNVCRAIPEECVGQKLKMVSSNFRDNIFSIPGFDPFAKIVPPNDDNLGPLISHPSIQYGQTNLISIATDNPLWSPGACLNLHKYYGIFKVKPPSSHKQVH